MAFQLSPGVLVQEKDLTNVVPAVATTAGAFVGSFKWGPVEEVTTISSENELASVFGKPDANTAQYFFTAANFLSYGNNLQVVRAASGHLNAVSTGGGLLVKNKTDFESKNAGVLTPVGPFIARCPGTLGNSLRVSVCSSATQFSTSAVTTVSTNAVVGATTVTVASSVNIVIGDLLKFGTDTVSYEVTDKNVGTHVLTIRKAGTVNTGLETAVSSTTAVNRRWGYADEFDSAPGTTSYSTSVGGQDDEIHVIVCDEKGAITGTIDQVLEKFAGVSIASDNKKSDGSNNYWRTVINENSQWVFAHGTPTGVDATEGTSTGVSTFNFTPSGVVPAYYQLVNGTDDNVPTDGELQTGYALFRNDELYDVSLIPVGPASGAVAKWVTENVAEYRKDCMVFYSPTLSAVNSGTEKATAVVTERNTTNISSSYAVIDSGWKYQYDRYNDVYRWVPLNGDVAGLCVRTDNTNDPWFSPAGLNRGQIKNVIKLAYTPDKTDRDTLYKAGINPVVNFPGQGIVLFGDKTLLSKPSAFDRINVRRLFIVLEKAIATASKYQLFEFNDDFTRAQFKNLVEPFLRDVQGRRGITDFKVVCDESNNTGEVIDRNEFVADIFIKPARSINFITLSFIATRTGVSFSEVAGA